MVIRDNLPPRITGRGGLECGPRSNLFASHGGSVALALHRNQIARPLISLGLFREELRLPPHLVLLFIKLAPLHAKRMRPPGAIDIANTSRSRWLLFIDNQSAFWLSFGSRGCHFLDQIGQPRVERQYLSKCRSSSERESRMVDAEGLEPPTLSV